jgi:hypothetical protein
VLFIKQAIETIYYLENPQHHVVKYASITQLKYESIVKDVFGVVCVNDIKKMLRYNKGFRQSVCEARGIEEDEITLDMIFRVASKDDLILLKNSLINKNLHDESIPDDQVTIISCPFNLIIQLQDGIYQWDEEKCSYEKLKTTITS